MKSSYDIITHHSLPCYICHEKNTEIHYRFDVNHIIKYFKIQKKYSYQGVCEDCLYTAKHKICTICNVQFMMHNGYHGNKPKCGYCINGYDKYYVSNEKKNVLYKNVKNIIISPEGFPYVINKLIL
jgi:hypothetical protein